MAREGKRLVKAKGKISKGKKCQQQKEKERRCSTRLANSNPTLSLKPSNLSKTRGTRDRDESEDKDDVGEVPMHRTSRTSVTRGACYEC